MTGQSPASGESQVLIRWFVGLSTRLVMGDKCMRDSLMSVRFAIPAMIALDVRLDQTGPPGGLQRVTIVARMRQKYAEMGRLRDVLNGKVKAGQGI